MRLVLVRHGQTTSNVVGALDTAVPGASLTELGREQAIALVGALAHEQIDLAVRSTLVRTHETLAPLAQARGLEPWTRDGIREIAAGDLEMRTDHEAITAYVDTLAAWFGGDLDHRMPGGESGQEVLARFDAVVAEVAASGAGTAVLVSHGAILRTWAVLRSHAIDAASLAHRGLTNTGVIVVEGSPDDGWQLVMWEGDAIGGPSLTDVEHDGPTA